MKNIKTIFINAHFIIVVCLFSITICFAQPVIKVPKACEVVVAGTGNGSATGFGGIVGDGGIVVMPDPFDFRSSEGDFYYVPNETELVEWNLLGDISMQTDTSYNEVLQPTGAINPLNLQSYNKNLRFAENPSASQPLLDPRWARSKGRVTVIYFKKSCNSSITFQILKRYTNKRDEQTQSVVPPILGSDCVLPNTTYTYSVDQIASDNANDEIGFDKYYWSGLPEGSSLLYNSGDNSSITFITGASVSSFTLQCCYGRANAWDGDTASPSHTTCITKQVGGQLSAPLFTPPIPSCHPTGVAFFAFTYANPPFGSIYTWSVNNAAWILATSVGATNTTLTVTTGSNTNPGLLVLTISGSCLPVIINYQIDRSITAPFTVIPTGTTTTCINATSSGNTYTLTPNAGGNSIQWFTVPASVTGVTLVNANTPMVTVNTSGASGSFTLSATSGVATCNSTSVSTTINIRPATPVFTSTAPSCVPLSSPGLTTFAVTPVAGAISYTWTLPPGWSCSANCTSANPTLIPPTNTFAMGMATLPPGTISVVANSASVCSSLTATFTVNYIRITSNTLNSGSGNCDQYSINTNVAPCTGTITNWTVGGVTSVSNGTTVNIFGNTLTLCGSTAPAAGGVCANIVIGGVSYTTCSSTFATGTHGLKQVSPKVILDGVTISPNPNSGIFFITVESFKETASATLYDITGKELSVYTLKKGENKIENEGLAKGSYLVKLDIDGKTESQQIIIK